MRFVFLPARSPSSSSFSCKARAASGARAHDGGSPAQCRVLNVLLTCCSQHACAAQAHYAPKTVHGHS